MDEKYAQYLASREWALLKKQVKKRAGKICERCKVAPMQQVHHVTYARVYQERLDDLLGVCRPCHEYLSGEHDHDPAHETQATMMQATGQHSVLGQIIASWHQRDNWMAPNYAPFLEMGDVSMISQEEVHVAFPRNAIVAHAMVRKNQEAIERDIERVFRIRPRLMPYFLDMA